MKFGLALLLMSVVCTVAWQNFVFGRLYFCSDALPFEFLFPGDWVHAFDGRAIEVVAQVAPTPYTGDPDQIKAGWSRAGLWALWLGMAGVSVAVSVGLARVRWWPDWRGGK
jgi:hypothetical protein